MLNLNSIMIGGGKLNRLAEYDGKLLDQKPEMEDSDYIGYRAGRCFISVEPHDKFTDGVHNPERIMYCLEANGNSPST